ncbi:MAG TPA: DNA mismatch repair protein MutS [Chloroflexota bacterium]|nr:DNA mismatch repair protein MutS [Chloroflexota bacterium]
MNLVHSPSHSDTTPEVSLTPLRRQYLELKRRFPDTILLFRLGDFYEAFDDDARILSSELDIVLTGRDVARGARIPMAGVPYHSLDVHLAKLIKKGYRVAVCEQLSDPKTSRGLVERDVTRVVTPGTVVEPALLDERRHNYLMAVVSDDRRVGLSYTDVTTGEFAATQLECDDSKALEREIERLQPAEVLIATEDALQEDLAVICRRIGARLSEIERWKVELANAREALERHFQVSSLEGLGTSGYPLIVRAAGAIVQYLGEAQKAALSQIEELRTYQTSDYMLLDATARRNLELVETARLGASRGSLIWVLDRTKTPGGARLLHTWLNQPLLDVNHLNQRLDAVEEFVQDAGARARLREKLGAVKDLERLINRVGQGVATPRDLLALKASLEAVPALREILQGDSRTVVSRRRQQLAAALDDGAPIVELIAQAIVDDPPANFADGGVIAPGFSSELDDINQSTSHAHRWIQNLEATERERTGIRGLKVGYNKVFGYFIEVSNANRSLVPDSYIRKQTLVGGERYVTAELKEYEAIVLNAKERVSELEQALFKQVCTQIASERQRVLRTARALSEADVYASLAEVAVQNRYVRPTLDEGTTIEIVRGRHPVVEQTRVDEPFTPNDLRLSTEDAQIIVLTGPNMAGKSTFLRQVALIVLLAQVGSFVPAESARIGLVDRIFTRVGAQDDVSAGQSTFLVEMLETAQLLTQSTRRSLLILDEVGRGTSTYDGMALAQAIIEYVHNHPKLGARTLFATHYHELTELAEVLPRVRNFRMDVREEGKDVYFLHRVVPGGADRSYGIHVARLAGIPRAITRRAEEILRDLERGDRRRTGRSAESVLEVVQLSFFGGPNPVLEELKSLDLLSLSPLEALSKLFELQEKAKSLG